MQEGIHKLTYPEYDAIQAMRNTHLKKALVSAKQFRWALDNPEESTGPMQMGNATHTKTLEPHLFDEQVAVFDGASRRGKAWDLFQHKNQSKIILLESELALVSGMAEACHANPIVSRIIKSAEAVEQTTVWRDPDTGLLCKARQDIVLDGVVYDLKTTSDITEYGSVGSAAKYGYYEQAAFYLEGISRCTGIDHKEFVFIFVQKEPPFEIRIVSATERAIQYGRKRNREALNLIAECTERNQWPGAVEDHIGILDIPSWAANEL